MVFLKQLCCLDKEILHDTVGFLARYAGCAPRTAYLAIMLLFLKGAANRGTPGSLSVAGPTNQPTSEAV
jgi:hypothetical protein